jgi:hypothetical protein
MRDRLHAYLGGIARENAMVAIAVGGVADHVHLLLSLPRAKHHERVSSAEEFRKFLMAHAIVP